MPDINNIEYTEVVEGYRERFTHDTQETIRVYQVAWDKRIEFQQALLGYSIWSATNKIDRRPPHADTSYPWLYAQEIDLITGLGYPGRSGETYTGGENTAWFFQRTNRGEATGEEQGLAKYAVTYRDREYKVSGGTTGVTTGGGVAGPTDELERYVIRRQTYATQAVTIPASSVGFLWCDRDDAPTAVALVENVTRLFPTKELTYIWMQVPVIPETSIQNCLGKVNASTFDSGGFIGHSGGFQPETLLLIGPHVERKPQGAMTRDQPASGKPGFFAWEITYKFGYRPTGWNTLYRISPPVGARSDDDFYRVVRNGTGADQSTGIYEVADFDSLFKMP